MSGLGREKLLGFCASCVEVGVLAIGSQPVDVLVYVIVGSAISSLTVGLEEWLGAAAVHDGSCRRGVEERWSELVVGVASPQIQAPRHIALALMLCFPIVMQTWIENSYVSGWSE